jgi:hypothetical protein
VTVLKSGVLFREKRYRSLSEIARVITGSRWSGPLFFGLKKQAQEASGDASFSDSLGSALGCGCGGVPSAAPAYS